MVVVVVMEKEEGWWYGVGRPGRLAQQERLTPAHAQLAGCPADARIRRNVRGTPHVDHTGVNDNVLRDL